MWKKKEEGNLKKIRVLGALGATISVLAFAAVALAQGIPEGQVPSQNTSDVQNSTSAPTQAPTETAAPAPSSTATVNIHDLTFDPAAISVAPGTTVTWTNNDTVAHTVTADDGLFDSGVLEPGQSYSTWLGGSGTVTYHCEIHPDMKGSVVVGEASVGGETPASNPPPNQAASVYP
jgi:plastocyanin